MDTYTYTPPHCCPTCGTPLHLTMTAQNSGAIQLVIETFLCPLCDEPEQETDTDHRIKGGTRR